MKTSKSYVKSEAKTDLIEYVDNKGKQHRFMSNSKLVKAHTYLLQSNPFIQSFSVNKQVTKD